MAEIHPCQYPMFPFYSEPGVQASYEFPPSMSPEAHFPASRPAYHSYEELSANYMLPRWMSSQIDGSQDLFSDYPSAVEEEFLSSREPGLCWSCLFKIEGVCDSACRPRLSKGGLDPLLTGTLSTIPR